MSLCKAPIDGMMSLLYFRQYLAMTYYDGKNQRRQAYVEVDSPYKEVSEEKFLQVRKTADADRTEFYDFGVTSDGDFLCLVNRRLTHQ